MRFLEYLLESQQLNENSMQYLIASFGQAKEYIEKYNCLEDTGLTMDDIKKMFEYSLSHQKTKAEIQKEFKGKPEPFVADYNGIPGKFALRRWVTLKKIVDEKKLSTKSSKNKTKNNLFAGFHDTSLKSGQQANTNTNANSGWQPSAQDYESLICLAYNIKNDALNNKEAAGLTEAEELKNKLDNGTVLEDEISETAHAKVYYLAHKEAIDAMVEPLFQFFKQSKGVRLDKLENADKVSNTWLKFGEVNGLQYDQQNANNTPKTDIISSNKKLRISCKKHDGKTGAQLMSGLQNEAVATIITALYRTFGKEDKWPDEIKTIKEQLTNKKWKKIKFQTSKRIKDLKNSTDLTPEEQQTLKDIEQGEKELSDIKLVLYNLISKNKKFENNLLYEAVTGNTKFSGEIDKDADNPPIANIVLVWNDNNIKDNAVYTISEYIKHIQSNNMVKYSLSYKTSGNSTAISLRIIIN